MFTREWRKGQQRWRWIIIFSGLVLLRVGTEKKVLYPVGQRVRLASVVTQETDLRGSKQVIHFEGLEVFTEIFPRILPGDRIEVFGRMGECLPKNTRGSFCLFSEQTDLFPAEGKIDWRLKMRREGVKIRFWLQGRIAKILPEPEAALLGGILLGAKSQFREDFYEKLQKSGVLHLVVASGTNIAFISGAVLAGLINLGPRRRVLVLVALVTGGYVFLSGVQPAVVRAYLMALAGLWAQAIGREKQAGEVLWLAVLVMLLIAPNLWREIGFQLSVAATAGILIFERLWRPDSFWRKNFWGRELAASLGAQAMILPIALHHFETVGVFSFVSSSLVSLLVPWAMSWGGLWLAVAAGSVELAGLLVWPVWGILKFMVVLIDFFGRNLGRQIGLALPGWGMAVYYLLIWVLFQKRRNEPKEN